MVDLHTHVLPAIDDGAKTVTESIKMLSDAYRQGVRVCAATPHAVLHKPDAVARFLKRRRESAEKLSEAIQKSGLPLPKLLLGAEVYLDHDIAATPSLDALCLGDSPYLLVELPFETYNPYWSEWLHSLILRGFRPIVAHLDRYTQAETMLSDFAGLDLIYQINASRLLSFSGRHFLSRLLKIGVPCIVASDMHNTTMRSCTLGNAYTKLRKKRPEQADALFSARAKQMLKPYFGGEKNDKTTY